MWLRADFGVSGAFVISDSFQPRRAQPTLHKSAGDTGGFSGASSSSKLLRLASADCRICAASLRFAGADVDAARAAAVLDASWFAFKWAAQLGDHLEAEPWRAD